MDTWLVTVVVDPDNEPGEYREDIIVMANTLAEIERSAAASVRDRSRGAAGITEFVKLTRMNVGAVIGANGRRLIEEGA